VTLEVQQAAAQGDRSENAEYIYGKKRLREIDRRMRFLISRLENVQPVDPGLLKGPKVMFGATVTVADEDGEQRTWRIYGEDEVDVEGGILSWKSPIAHALLGRQVGDQVRFRAPGGLREIEIVRVQYEAQAPLPEPTDGQPPGPEQVRRS
jgi:transcription elongation factor GreB